MDYFLILLVTHTHTHIYIYIYIYIYILYIRSPGLPITKESPGQTVQSGRARPHPDVYKIGPGVLGFSFSRPSRFISDGGCPIARATVDPGQWLPDLDMRWWRFPGRRWRPSIQRASGGSQAGGRNSISSTCGGGGSSIRSGALVRASGGVPEAPRRRHFQGRRASDARRRASSDSDARRRASSDGDA
jgi:hypothetical protein